MWSDGKPVTGADFVATWKVFINPATTSSAGRVGRTSSRSRAARARSVTVVFKKQYADWEALVSSGVYPAHIIAGQDMNQMFLNTRSPSPAVRGSSTAGRRACSSRSCKNAAFKAGPKMKLDRVVFRYILDTNARFQALKAGEGQVMEPQPQLQIADFLKDKKFVVDQKIGYAWEHLDIQFGPQGHPALKQPYVRQALITGINRKQIADALYADDRPGPAGAAEPRSSSPSRRHYKKNWAVYKFNQQKVISHAEEEGLHRWPDKPSANNSDIFSCPNVGKLSFRFGTTTGNQLRALAFEIMQRQLKSVGIELVPRFQVAGTLFGTTLPSGDWDLVMFTWVGSPRLAITSRTSTPVVATRTT